MILVIFISFLKTLGTSNFFLDFSSGISKYIFDLFYSDIWISNLRTISFFCRSLFSCRHYPYPPPHHIQHSLSLSKKKKNICQENNWIL